MNLPRERLHVDSYSVLVAMITLTGLDGTHPRDAMAAFGVMAALARPLKGRARSVALSWTQPDGFTRRPVIRGLNAAQLIKTLTVDLAAWATSPLLTGPDQLRLHPTEAAPWIGDVLTRGTDMEEWMLRGLVTTDLADRTSGGRVRSTQLDMTSGQMRFLRQVRRLREATTVADIESALFDGTERAQRPNLRWGLDVDRHYALRATDPADEQYLPHRGVEWLAWRSLGFWPVASQDPQAGLSWPIWAHPRTVDDLTSMLAPAPLQGPQPLPCTDDPLEWHHAAIRRDDHYYGHFAPPSYRPAAHGHERLRQLAELRRKAEETAGLILEQIKVELVAVYDCEGSFSDAIEAAGISRRTAYNAIADSGVTVSPADHSVI